MNKNENLPESKKSKSQVKREMLELQLLGEQLVALSKDQLKKIPLEETLLTAIKHAQTITSHEGRRRQLQYIGKLMRQYDVEPAAAAYAALNQQSDQSKAFFNRLEKLRDQLIVNGDSALNEVLAEFPLADRQHLRQLIRQAQIEQEKNLPPASARKLFRYLRELAEEKKL